jgi:hypothetical protein
VFCLDLAFFYIFWILSLVSILLPFRFLSLLFLLLRSLQISPFSPIPLILSSILLPDAAIWLSP